MSIQQRNIFVTKTGDEITIKDHCDSFTEMGFKNNFTKIICVNNRQHVELTKPELLELINMLTDEYHEWYVGDLTNLTLKDIKDGCN